MDETGTWIENRAGADVLRVRTIRLDVVDGPDRGLTKTFSAPAITLGRANADFPLADRRVSALHAELRLEAGGFRLRDYPAICRWIERVAAQPGHVRMD